MSDYRRGDVFYVESFVTTGSEQRPGRPAIIVSNEKGNQYSNVVEVVYMTTRPKPSLPTHVSIYSSRTPSIALCEQITTVDKSRIGDYMCTLTPGELRQVEKAMIASLGFLYEQPQPAATEQEEPASEEEYEDYDGDEFMEEASTQLQSKIVKLRENLIRERTAARIYKRFYDDVIAQQKQVEDIIEPS